MKNLPFSELVKAAAETFATNRVAMDKLATQFFANQFPNLSAAFDAYEASKAEHDAQAFPALHATQPAMMMAQQQMMMGGDPSMSQQPVYHHRRHRHHS